MPPLKLAIRKKYKIPNNHPNYPYRMVFKTVLRVQLYPGRTISTEAQLAKYIYDRFGEGIYLVLRFADKIKNFWYGQCMNDGFIRLKAKERSWKIKEIDRMKNELLETKQRLDASEDIEEKEMLKNDIISLKDDIAEEEKDYKSTKNKKKVGPSPYLKISKPVGVKHLYEDYD